MVRRWVEGGKVDGRSLVGFVHFICSIHFICFVCFIYPVVSIYFIYFYQIIFIIHFVFIPFFLFQTGQVVTASAASQIAVAVLYRYSDHR